MSKRNVYFSNLFTPRECPYCGDIYQPRNIKQITCGKKKCRIKRIRECELARQAFKSEWAEHVFKWHSRGWIKRRMKNNQVQYDDTFLFEPYSDLIGQYDADEGVVRQ